jgi:hypothetical protein
MRMLTAVLAVFLTSGYALSQAMDGNLMSSQYIDRREPISPIACCVGGKTLWTDRSVRSRHMLSDLPR